MSRHSKMITEETKITRAEREALLVEKRTWKMAWCFVSDALKEKETNANNTNGL